MKQSRDGKACVFTTKACLNHSRDGKACVFTTSACLKQCRDGKACVFTTSACLKHSQTETCLCISPQTQVERNLRRQQTVRLATRACLKHTSDGNLLLPVAISACLKHSSDGNMISHFSQAHAWMIRLFQSVPRICIPPWAGGITANVQILCRQGLEHCREACSVLGSAPVCGAQDWYPEEFLVSRTTVNSRDASGTDTPRLI